jgi:hypothetical protein
MHETVKLIVDSMFVADENFYSGNLTNHSIRVFNYTNSSRGLWAGGRNYSWSPKNNDSHHMLCNEAGPNYTAALLVKYNGNKEMTYLTWYNAAVQSLVNKAYRKGNEGWYGDVYKMIQEIDIILLKEYDHEFQYHHACTNVLPIPIPLSIYKPPQSPSEMGAIAANLAFITASFWNLAKIEYVNP